jgi:hypothetical protein
MVVLKRVRLGPQHHPSLTKHTISDISGTREFPPFVEWVIAADQGETSCYLFHVCADGQAADTWHESVEEAVDQAEWEFGVQPDEWAAPDHPETF